MGLVAIWNEIRANPINLWTPGPYTNSGSTTTTTDRMKTDYPISLFSRTSRERPKCRPGLGAGWCGLGVVAMVVSGCVRAPEPGEPIQGAKILSGIGDTPGRLMYPRAMEFGPDGLWIIDRSGRVQRVDVTTNLCTGLTHMPEVERGKPTGMCIGPGFNTAGALEREMLYIADTHYHRVLVVRPPAIEPIDATRARTFEIDIVRAIGTFGTGGGEFYYPTDVCVAYGADGQTPERYFVSEYGGHDRVSIFDAQWNFVSSFGSFGSSAEAGNVQFGRPQSLAILGTGTGRRLVVTDSCNHRLGVFTLDGKLVRWVGSRAPGAGEGTGGDGPALPSTIEPPTVTSAGPVAPAKIGAAASFLFPYGVQGLADGSVLVAEFGASRVQRVNLETGACLGSWGRPGREIGELAVPWEVRAQGRTAYVLDSGNNRVQTFSLPVEGAHVSNLMGGGERMKGELVMSGLWQGTGAAWRGRWQEGRIE